MKLLIYCSGGLAREVMDIARRVNMQDRLWEEIVFLDIFRDAREHYGARVLKMEDVAGGGYAAVVANGEPVLRKKLRKELEAQGIALTTLIDPAAVISETAAIGVGGVVFPQCFVSSNAKIGSNVTLVAGAMIGHDSEIGDDCTICGAVNIGGSVRIGECAFIGMGTQVKQSVVIGNSVVIGMGSVVYNDISDNVVALGNPCRPMRNNVDGGVFRSLAGSE